jgi:hypothetical protein
MQEQFFSDSEIGMIIGEVKTNPHDMTGNYYGDASNYYSKGTKYYEIIGTSTSKAIAVKEESQLVKAVYVHKAPFHIMNIFSSPFFLNFDWNNYSHYYEGFIQNKTRKCFF